MGLLVVQDLIHRRRASNSEFTARTLSCASSLHSLPSAASPAAPSVDSGPPSPRVLDKSRLTEDDLTMENQTPAVADSATQSQAYGQVTAFSPLGPLTRTVTAAAESIVAASAPTNTSSDGVEQAPVAQASFTDAASEGASQTTAPVRQQRLKPKKGALIPAKGSPKNPSTPPVSAELSSDVQMSRLKKSISTAALSGRLLETSVMAALESGLVADSDVNVYGMRTPWHGTTSQSCVASGYCCFAAGS